MPRKPTAPSSSDRPSFEQALDRAEQIVAQLEDAEIGLEEALAHYEEGVQLLRWCHDLLRGAERRIELLSGVDGQGQPIVEPFDAASSLESGPQGPRRSRRRESPPAGGCDMDSPDSQI